MTKIRLLLLALLASFSSLLGSNSDSLDVLHYGIHLDTVINTQSLKKVYAHTEISMISKVNSLTSISRDLLKFQIDSIFVNGASASFSYNDTLLIIHPATAPNLGDTADVVVWYQGQSSRDLLFGGLYFQGNYVFNLGVGLNSDPHVYGRGWFPCKDNFIDRAYFDFWIRADSGSMAVCNGKLQSTTLHPDGTSTYHWQLRDHIPTYLAGFAIGPYHHIQKQMYSISGDTLDFDIYAQSSDTTNAKNQSSNLLAGINAFENRFGAYSWERVGFVIVNLPLSGSVGAMEHATNVAYPRILLSQGQGYETVWAHEAAHSWFGNLVTCEEEGEMWLNEGWASFCESLFEEAVYGFQVYKAFNRDTHGKVLRQAYIEDGGYQPLSGMPHEFTYGRTTYSRGALVAHSLRGQMGDSAFFDAVRSYLNTYQFRHVNSDSMQIALETASGQSLQNFFDTWVRQPGFLHISLDSFVVSPAGPFYSCQINLRQRLKAATQYGTDLKVPLRLIGSNFEQFDTTVIVTGPNTIFNISLTFEPVCVLIDPEEWIADATTDNYKPIYFPSVYSFGQTFFELTVSTVPDSALLQVVHHWIAPDSFQNGQVNEVLSNSRYWTVTGLVGQGFSADAKFFYNGNNNSAGWLDHTWLTMPEDSLKIYYRPSAQFDWQLWPNFTKNLGNPNDRMGNIQVHGLLLGDYALGGSEVLTANAHAENKLDFKVWPNPNSGQFQVSMPYPVGKFKVRLVDEAGNVLFSETVEDQDAIAIEKAYLSQAWYLVVIEDENGRVGSRRVLIER